ncbi:Ribokinase-like protein [Annulohypoxylon bovei var. microspora]|nr:Ribokinase-like protein [Annulohypoxylon bovei var. microspora]
MSTEPPVPETSVLAVASHVVSGNVGNKIAVFVLQSMGCDVSALNTVQFSNHTGYGQWEGRRFSAEEITGLWKGLKQSYLDDIDMMLSGYVPGAEAVMAVGDIGKELRHRSGEAGNPGSFFWVLDPVMGDNGRLYVAESVIPAYKSLIHYADLILPNQFEAELLSGVKITDPDSLEHAIRVLHQDFGVPHIVITSVSIPLFSSSSAATPQAPRTMAVVGSSMTSDRRPRAFKISFPVFEAYFSGTGDMFAALMVVRIREAVANYDKLSNGVEEGKEKSGRLGDQRSWLSDDGVDTLDLPLARAAEKVLASMHEVLERTCGSMISELQTVREQKGDDLDEKTLHLLKSKAAELKLVRNLGCLRDPKIEYRAEKM